MLHLLGRAVGLFAAVITENKVLRLNRIFHYSEILCGKLIMIQSTISPSLYHQEVYTLLR